jgi:hypothetical protein
MHSQHHSHKRRQWRTECSATRERCGWMTHLRVLTDRFVDTVCTNKTGPANGRYEAGSHSAQWSIGVERCAGSIMAQQQIQRQYRARRQQRQPSTAATRNTTLTATSPIQATEKQQEQQHGETTSVTLPHSRIRQTTAGAEQLVSNGEEQERSLCHMATS